MYQVSKNTKQVTHIYTENNIDKTERNIEIVKLNINQFYNLSF